MNIALGTPQQVRGKLSHRCFATGEEI